MANWIAVEKAKLDRPKIEGAVHRPQRTMNIEVFVSPYDVPQALRGYYDYKVRRFVVEFRYLSEEPLRPQPEQQHLKLWLGKNSGRLYRIEADLDAIGATAVTLTMLSQRITNALADLVTGSPLPHHPLDNYQIAGELIGENARDIFHDLGSATA